MIPPHPATSVRQAVTEVITDLLILRIILVPHSHVRRLQQYLHVINHQKYVKRAQSSPGQKAEYVPAAHI